MDVDNAMSYDYLPRAYGLWRMICLGDADICHEEWTADWISKTWHKKHRTHDGYKLVWLHEADNRSRFAMENNENQTSEGSDWWLNHGT